MVGGTTTMGKQEGSYAFQFCRGSLVSLSYVSSNWLDLTVADYAISSLVVGVVVWGI